MGHDSLDTMMIYVKATRADVQSEFEKIAWQLGNVNDARESKRTSNSRGKAAIFTNTA